MIAGSVGAEGVPVILIAIGNQQWRAVIDTGFNGELELPEATFTTATEILIGTGMLRQHRLQVHFPNRSVALERAA